jgi:hypothetical protein
MVSGTLTSTLRPIRIAFVIRPWDRAAALRAMQISTFLWGGTYNPIIPFHQRIDSGNRFFHGAKSAKEVFDGYLKAYDPDFVVRLGAVKESKVNLGSYQEIDADEILSGVLEDGTPSYGIGLFEILRHLLDEEFRFVRRENVAFEIPEVGNSLLWTSIFGDVTSELRDTLDLYLKEFPEYRRVPCTNENYLEAFRSENYFLRKLGNRLLDPKEKGLRNDWIYLMDGSSVEDVVFYWNLRALGRRILPFPIAAKDVLSPRTQVEQYIEENHWPYRHNASMFNHTTLLKAPSISEATHQEFADSLNLKPSKKEGSGKLITQDWIPGFWSEWNRRRNGGERCEVSDAKKEIKLSPIENCFYVPPFLPEFTAEYSGHGTPRCANELEPRVYGETGTYAEVIPEGGELVSRAVDRYSMRELRCSADGLVYYPTHQGMEHRLELPLAETVFHSWFKERGWETSLSDNGHIVKHVLKQFGGVWGTNWLTDEVILKLLMQIAAEKWLEKKAFRAIINQTANKVPFADVDRLTKWLVDTNIVKLGVELTCPQCRQRSWYSVSEADYEVECRQCLESFKLPCDKPDEIRWAYRGNGAFTSQFGTQGGLAVILTLRLFSGPSSGQVTPMFSFNAKKDGKEMEVDLALHTRRVRGGFPERNVIFIECKSYNGFSKVDVERMEAFTQSFPGAAMVFSTLRRELEPYEIKMLARVAKRTWAARLKGNAFTPLIILTGNELFSSTEPWSTWEKLGGKFARYGRWPSYEEEIDYLAEATQFFYLNFDANDFRRRQRPRRIATASGQPRREKGDAK